MEIANFNYATMLLESSTNHIAHLYLLFSIMIVVQFLFLYFVNTLLTPKGDKVKNPSPKQLSAYYWVIRIVIPIYTFLFVSKLAFGDIVVGNFLIIFLKRAFNFILIFVKTTFCLKIKFLTTVT